MQERRELKRRRLVHQVQVFDRPTERFLGNIVDVTAKGLLLITQTKVLEGMELQVRMDLPEAMFGKGRIDFDAEAVWRKRDVNPGFFDIGLRFTRISARDQEIIRQMIAAYGLVA